MKIKKTYIATFHRLFCLLVTSAVMTGCLYEHPELTEDGELGIDPTEVNVNIDLTMNLKIGSEESITRAQASAETTYRHRIIVDAYLNRELAARQIIYKELTDAEVLNASIKMKLHARDYQLVVWADYVTADSDADLYYNTTTLIPVIPTDTYRGNAKYKDVLYGNQALNLSNYRDKWNMQIPVNMELKRPVAHYELIADDVAKFLKKIADKEIKGTKFNVTVRYTDFYYTGFNALDGITKHALQYITYNRSITAPAEETKELGIAFDYVFAGDEETKIPIAVEVADQSSNLIARTYLLLSCKADQSRTIRSNFLTADPSGGVGFDPDFDDSINDDNIEIE